MFTRTLEIVPFGSLSCEGQSKVWETEATIPPIDGGFLLRVHGTKLGPTEAQMLAYTKVMGCASELQAQSALSAANFLLENTVVRSGITVNSENVWEFLTSCFIEVHESESDLAGEEKSEKIAISLGLKIPWENSTFCKLVRLMEILMKFIPSNTPNRWFQLTAKKLNSIRLNLMKTTKFKVAFVVIGWLLTTSISFAQETSMKKEIPPNDFYAKALKDKATIASFESVVAWQKEGAVVLIDLRSTQEFNNQHVKGAINLPATELTDEALSKVIPTKNFKVVIYCANNLFPSRRVALTTLAYPTLKQLGYKNVQLLDYFPPKNMLSAPSPTLHSSGTPNGAP